MHGARRFRTVRIGGAPAACTSLCWRLLRLTSADRWKVPTSPGNAGRLSSILDRRCASVKAGSMWGRSRKKATTSPEVVSVRGGSVGGPETGQATGTPFGIGVGSLLTDPKSNWQAYINPGTAQLLLFRPRGGSVVTVDLRSLPRDRWTAIDDQEGKRTPLETCLTARGLIGRWVVLVGGNVSPDSDSSISDAERRQITADMFNRLAQDHGNTMGWINNIR